MSNERDLQKKTLVSLRHQGYEYLGENLTENDLQLNFYTQIEKLNKKVLPDGLSASEKLRLWNALPLTMRLAHEALRFGIKLVKDDNREVNLQFIDKHNVERNIFQVAEEINIKGVTRNRLDLIILINGIPVSNIELKAKGNRFGVDEALNQINRYSREGLYSHGLMKFIQVFTISNDVITKYFAASPRAEKKEPYKKAFYWTTEDNKPVHDLSLFVEAFYDPSQFLTLLLHYMLLTPADAGNDAYILRPYQYYAVQRSTERLEESEENGFIWHATGSGKTLTSYILASSLSQGSKFSKVIMLLDRNDLADQTISEYRSFNPDFVRTASKGKDLHKQIVDRNQKFVMTTMQSFARWLVRHEKTSKALNSQPVCFVVDECHRTTFGLMFKSVRKTFTNAQLVGFTGTPRLVENPTDSDLLTKDIFGEPIHVYTTKNAINDGNVLPFSVHEVNIKTDKLDIKKNKEYYRSDERMQTVADHIVNNLWKSTEQKYEIKPDGSLLGYTAMLAAQGKREAYRYWKLITSEMKKQNRTTALVYSITDNAEDDGEGLEQEWYLKVLEDHDENFDTNFAVTWSDDKEGTRKAHLRDVTRRVKNKDIDLLIVSDMLLTGFDAQTLNTIYLDKKLDYHNLLQAMSRTNRNHEVSGKQHGNVVIFSDREMNGDIDSSILLFSNGDNTEGVIERKLFKTIFLETLIAVQQLTTAVPEPKAISSIEDPNVFVKTLELYTNAKSLVRNIQTYDEWESKDWKKLGINSDLMDEYYAHIYEQAKKFSSNNAVPTEVLENISFHISHISEYKIDVAYINELLRGATYAPKKEKDKWVKRITNAVNLSDDPTVISNKEAIINTAHAVRKGEVKTHTELEARYMEEQHLLEEARYMTYSADFNVDIAKFRYWVQIHRTTQHVPYELIGEELRSQGLSLFRRPEIQKQIVHALTTKFN